MEKVRAPSYNARRTIERVIGYNELKSEIKMQKKRVQSAAISAKEKFARVRQSLFRRRNTFEKAVSFIVKRKIHPANVVDAHRTAIVDISVTENGYGGRKNIVFTASTDGTAGVWNAAGALIGRLCIDEDLVSHVHWHFRPNQAALERRKDADASELLQKLYSRKSSKENEVREEDDMDAHVLSSAPGGRERATDKREKKRVNPRIL